jgi:signal transduction histidine kinase/ligand-binding sensor domain-containing protein
MEDRKGKLWFSTNIIGIWNYDPDSKGVTRVEKRPNSNSPNSFPAHARITQDQHGTIWIGASDYLGGVLRFDEDSPLIEKSHYDHIMGQTFDILSDREGTLWVASREGLFRLRPMPFDSISFDGVGSRSGVRSIVEAPDGQLWFGSRRVFASWAKETLTVVDGLLSLKPSFTSSMIVDRKAQVWVGYPGGGIAKLSSPNAPSQFAPQFIRQFPEIGELRGAALRSQGGLWLGTDTGLFSLSSDEKIRSVSTDLKDISCLIEDRSQGVWMGTYNQGLGYRAKDDSEPITHLEGLPSNHIGAIYQDSSDHIWVGTEKGLVKIQQQTVLRPPVDSPLPKGRIDGIVEDDLQRLWISHDGGVSRVQIKDAASHFSNELPSLSVANFSTEHGISGVQRPSGIPPCNTALKSRDGRLWFTRYSGILTVDPSKLPLDVPAPTVLIQKLTANGTHYKPIPNRLLPAGSGRLIEIEFTTASLYQPENVILDYRLKGLDTFWRRAERERIATYLNLTPGEYELEVRARNHEGRWTEKPSSLRFQIAPYFFETWWFGLILFSSASGVIAFLLYRRFRQQRVAFETERLDALKRERTRIARDIHDHLGAQLSATALQSAPAASELAADSLKELRDLIWSVDPEQDTLDGFIDFIADFASRFLAAAEIELELNLPSLGLDRPFDQRIRLELAAVFKEALNNIVKHSNAREVKILLSIEPQRLGLSIQDDGIGITSQGSKGMESPKGRCGNGLPNMRSRIKGLGGSFDLRSKPDLGVGISIEVPIS